MDPTSSKSKLKFLSHYTLSLRGGVKVYQGPFYGQDASPILGVQAKHIIYIALMLTLVNVWLVYKYSPINTLLRDQCNTFCPIVKM